MKTQDALILGGLGLLALYLYEQQKTQQAAMQAQVQLQTNNPTAQNIQAAGGLLNQLTTAFEGG